MLVLAVVALVGFSATARTADADSTFDFRRLQTQINATKAAMVGSVVQVRVGESQGSGVIVSADGLVLTAAHVTKAPGRMARLTLADGREVKATTLGLDESVDTAMIRITEAGKYSFAPLAKSDSLRPGQWCLAAGFPGRRATDGVAILRIGRVLFASHSVVGTDNTLIGGDSGGALFNLQGEVVAIHSRIGMRLTTNLHVPIRTFHDNWDRLAAGETIGSRRTAPKTTKQATRPMIGVTGVPDQSPCTITRVFPGSPAAKAGLKTGDIVEKVDGRRVADFRHLAWILHDMQPKQRVVFELKRGSKSLKIEVELGRARGPIPGGAPPRKR